MRRAQPGKLTREAEQAFLAALSATCNVSLAAAAVGACFNAFNRRRKTDPAFAREMRMALERGYEALELALIESGLPGSHEHDDWRSNDPPATPPMSVSQALQLMYLHQKEARLLREPDHLRRRRGESREAHNFRLIAMAEARLQREREKFAVAEAERMARGEPPWGPAGEAVRRSFDTRLRLRSGATQDERGEGASRGVNPRDVDPAGLRPLVGRPVAGSSTEARLCSAKPPFCSAAPRLPDLAHVYGWSRADPGKVPHHPQRALFGGWRIEDMEARCGARPRPG